MSDYDLIAALSSITVEIDRSISAVEGVLMKQNLPDREAIMIALDDLIRAKAGIIEGLTSEEVAH